MIEFEFDVRANVDFAFVRVLVNCHRYKIGFGDEWGNIIVIFRIIFNTCVERLQNEIIVNGDDHDTTIHVLVMSSKLSKYLSYYVARFILIYLSAYLVL